MSQAKETLVERYESKDKESLERDLTGQRLTEQVQETARNLQSVGQERDALAADKLELSQLVEQLKAQVSQLSSDKEGL